MRVLLGLHHRVRDKHIFSSCAGRALVVCLGLLSSSCQYRSADLPSTPNSVVIAAEKEQIYRPAQQLEDLFVAVQMQQVFTDSKTFVDSRSKRAPAEVLSRYHAAKDKSGFDLREFVDRHFEVPQASPVTFALDADLTMEQHLRSHWHYLTRSADENERWSTLIPLPYSYVVPGGRFREIYYWDSYFTMHGLVASDRLDLTEDMIKNFAWLIDQVGHVPNGNRTYYLSRSQPPFFAAMVSLLQTQLGEKAAAEFLPAMVKEYQFWMSGADQLVPGEAHRRVVMLSDGTLLNRYYDDLDQPRPESYREDVFSAQSFAADERPRVYRDIRAAAESGWDFSSRWFADHKSLETIHTTDIIPVDLNSLLYHLERTISELHAVSGDMVKFEEFARKAQARKSAINRWLWDNASGTYGDYRLTDEQFTGVQSLATVYPLYFGVATLARAETVAKQLRDRFLMPGGLVTTLNDTGEQWDYPNGWAPLQWLAINGLSRYGQQQLSDEIASRWLSLNRKVFNETGRMMEKYNVVDISLPAGGGEYPLQDGFGWTNGVVLGLTEDVRR